MLVENSQLFLKLKPSNYYSIEVFYLNKLKDYPKKDVIIIIDFVIDEKLIVELNKWNIHLSLTKNILVIVIDKFDKKQFNDNDLLVLPTLEEANDYIELENIKRDLEKI
tara:strand:- start:181 stop:507 length:327 start_codon:yes stop_codon:yes gene_type:complete